MRPKAMNLQFPVAGVVRRLGLRAVADTRGPYPSPWALNVRLEDSLTNRLRGGSFTGQVASSIDEPRYLAIVTENGDPIVTENGDPIVLGPQYGVATGDGRAWVSAGTDGPSSGTADCLYRARLFCVDGNAILVSRLGDVTDWFYGADFEDTGRPTILQLSEAGEVGDAVVAMVPHKDSFLLCFTASETWVLHGDPLSGTLRNVSREVGIIAPRAWCKNHDTVYFLSSLGLYSVGADGSDLKAVSDDKIPEDLTGVTDADCVLDYYHADAGVYIHLTASPSWFYDTERDQFWPFDTTETDSHLLVGPFQLGNQDFYGRVLNLHGNIAAGSDDVIWRLILGDTAEDAADDAKAAILAELAGTSFDDYVAASGTWAAGRSHMAYPRIRGMWAVLWLHSEGTWAYEAVSLEAELSGKWR